MQQQMQPQEEQKRDPAAGSAGSSAMEPRLDHLDHHVGDGPAGANASDAAAVADSASPRGGRQEEEQEEEGAVMLTGGEAHNDSHLHHQHQYQHRLDTQPSISTGSHGAAIGGVRAQERRLDDHVAGTQVNSPGTSPGATATSVIDNSSSSSVANAAESYEQQHVHSVYESIAAHFSSTRYKPWPFVASFLASLPPGSVGLDVGCGNGKYLGVNPHIFIVGSDRSANLVRLARDQRVRGLGSADESKEGEVGSGSNSSDVAGIADGLELPFGGQRRVDFAICIAVVHHLSTRERRVEAVRALLDCVRPGDGKILVYVWALEQGSSRRGWDESTADQDQLVPWVMKINKLGKPKRSAPGKKEKKEKRGPNLEEGVQDKDGGSIISKDDIKRNGCDGNYLHGDTTGTEENVEKTYQRYYHLYRKGELEEDVVTAGGEVLASGYEKDNWWAIASPKVEGCNISSTLPPVPVSQ
ncbi:tRNA methyltransferase, has a role in tRNA modification [Parahypoxylon ruwenzoriense]